MQLSFKQELRTLLTLMWPLLIAQVTQTLMGVSDTVMAGQYSYTDMAAVAIGFSITFPLLCFVQGISFALSPIVSRLQGAKTTEPVANATQQSVWLTFLISCLLLLLIPFIPVIFSHLDMQQDLREITIQYVIYLIWCAPGFAIYQSLRNCCEGLSSTRPTMIIMLLGLAINIPLNYVLINGKFGFPALGGVGCGIATMIVFYTMALATILHCRYSSSMKNYGLFNHLHLPSYTAMLAQFKLGLPIALTILFEVTLFGAVAILLAPFGAQLVAAHQIALNFSSLMFMLPVSVGIAVAIRIGFHIGERKPENAQLAIRCALVCALVIASTTASITILANTLIAELYTDNIDVITIAAGLLFYAALFQFSDGIQVVSANSLRGYKDTKAMLIISFFSYWIIGLPLGCILGLTDWLFPQMYAEGFWIGFIGGLSTAAILMFMRVRIIQRRIRLTGIAH